MCKTERLFASAALAAADITPAAADITPAAKAIKPAAKGIAPAAKAIKPAANGIARAAKVLRSGGTVAFPTETVYGLGADALNPQAVARIFLAKDRPGWDPLIVHIADRAMLDRIATVPATVLPQVARLIAAFWPGPLTLLLPRTAAVPDAVTAGRPLVGVRMPAHPVALKLIRLARAPIAAPSANRFGHTSPTTAAHVLEDLDGRIDAVLDGGPTSVGIESTVLDVTQTPMLIYRPGAITPDQIAKVSGCAVETFIAGPFASTFVAGQIAGPFASTFVAGQIAGQFAGTKPQSLPSPGVDLRHYAPRARLKLVFIPESAVLRTALHRAIEKFHAAEVSIGVMLPEDWDASDAQIIFPWGSWADPALLAQRLFAGLRALDAQDVDFILCPAPEGDGIAAAIRDRLEKAARKK